jgi:hypothetical protein
LVLLFSHTVTRKYIVMRFFVRRFTKNRRHVIPSGNKRHLGATGAGGRVCGMQWGCSSDDSLRVLTSWGGRDPGGYLVHEAASIYQTTSLSSPETVFDVGLMRSRLRGSLWWISPSWIHLLIILCEWKGSG